MTETPLPQNDRFVSLTPVAGLTTLSWDFPLTRADGLAVIRIRAGSQAVLVRGVDYTFPAGLGGDPGGTLTLSGPTQAGDVYLLIGLHPEERLSDFLASRGFSTEKINEDLDALTIIAQEHRRDIDRAVKVDYGQPGLTFPRPGNGQLLGYDAAGKLVASETTIDERSERIAGDKALASLIGQAGEIETQVFDTALAASMATIKPTIQAILTGGYSVPDDGRGGLFVSYDTGSDDTFVSGDGRTWWRAADVSQARLAGELLATVTRPESFLKYRKKVAKNLPIRFPDYDVLISNLGAEYILPQAFTIDWIAKQIFVLCGTEKPITVRAEWFIVWSFNDMTDPNDHQYEGCFGVQNYSTTAFSEGFEVLYEGDRRFLYASNTDRSVSKFDITALPTNMALLTSTDALWTRNVGLHSQFSYRNGQWIVQQLGPAVGTRNRRHNFAVYNSDLTARTGTVTFPLEDIGPWTYDKSYADAIPKTQSMHIGNGFYFASTGGFHAAGEAIPYSYQGLKMFGSDGRLIEENLIDPEALRLRLNAFGYPSYKIEYEGAHQAPDGRIYSLCMTISPLNTVESYLTGILIFEEYARGEGAIDFSADARTYPKPDIVRWSSGIWPRSRDGKIHNPITGEELTSWDQICDMLAGLDIPRLAYYTSATSTIVDVNGETLPGGCLVEIVNCDNVTFKVFVFGFGFARIYTIFGSSGARGLIRRSLNIHSTVQLTSAQLLAGYTWTVGSETYLDTDTLDAAGTITLSSQNAVRGDRVEIKRRAGAGSLAVINGVGTVIATLNSGQSAVFVMGGANFILWSFFS